MILSIGEILADMTGHRAEGGLSFTAHLGGAPFNLACYAKRAGAKAGFVGRVGDDLIGRFLLSEAERAGLDTLILTKDKERSTSLAFVTLTEGERAFSFFRHDTADAMIEEGDIPLDTAGLTTLHIGSLMFTESRGRKLAEAVLTRAQAMGIRVTFDVNYRSDLFSDISIARGVYRKMIEKADIVKFSDEELLALSGKPTVEEGLAAVGRAGKLTLVSCGVDGAAFTFGDEIVRVPTTPVRAVDTTGAGDAFFGTFLAKTDGKVLTPALVSEAVAAGNRAGAVTVGFEGAIQL